QEVAGAIVQLGLRYAHGESGIRLRELAGGWTYTSDPASEEAARRLFSRTRVAALTPAQAETLAIISYLQPVSRPEITRIRGVSADSATSTLLDRAPARQAHSRRDSVRVQRRLEGGDRVARRSPVGIGARGDARVVGDQVDLEDR